MASARAWPRALLVAAMIASCLACSLVTSFDGFGGEGAAGDAGGAPDAEADAEMPPVDGASDETVDAVDAAGAVDALAPSDGPEEREASPPACPGVQIPCNGSCVDPTTDPNHCGGCNTVCESGLCGDTLAADMRSSPPGWTFNGTAAWDWSGPSARMTEANAASATGTVVYGHAIVTDQFTATFQFRIGAGGGERDDGMGFVIESTGPTAIGVGNGSFGMGGLAGYGVEFDVFDNMQCGDASDDHVGVDSLTECTNLPTSLFANDLTDTIDLADGQWHAASVSLAAGAISVSIDGAAFAQNVALTGFASGTPYYYGFSGATGGIAPNGGLRMEVKTVTIAFPTPRCL